MYISLFFPWFGVCIYVEIFFDLVRNQASDKVTKVLQKNTKGSWKVYVTWTFFKFWPMIKIFWQLWANKSLTKIWRIIVARNFWPTLFKLKRGILLPWQNNCANFKTTCLDDYKTKFFFFTKLVKNLLLVKYFLYAAVTITWIIIPFPFNI